MQPTTSTARSPGPSCVRRRNGGGGTTLADAVNGTGGYATTNSATDLERKMVSGSFTC